MFVQFILPYDFDRRSAAYMWIMHRAVQNMKGDLRIVAPDVYWANSPHVINAVQSIPTDGDFEYLISRCLSVADLDIVEKETIDLSYYQERLAHVPQSKILAFFQQEEDEQLTSDVNSGLGGASSIEALLLWTNCRSAVKAAKRASIQTIFNEMGPLRPPLYRPTVYFDFKGLHDQSEAESRWNLFRENVSRSALPLFDRESLCSLLRIIPLDTNMDEPKYEVGVALQAPGAAHMDYSAGFTNHCAIDWALRHLGTILSIRAHPGQRECYPDLAAACDESETPEEFIKQCNAIVTINSGIAFEALLLGKPTYVLGRSPIATGAWDTKEKICKLEPDLHIRWLNWFVFGYLVPFELSFDCDYYRWRLTHPSEEEIYIRNFSWWAENGAKG